MIGRYEGLDEPALVAWAERFGSWLLTLKTPPSTITVGLNGPLGAGKTTLVRALVSSLPGAEPNMVTSPTYALLHVYPTQPEVRHVDLYRLQHGAEVEELGFDEILSAPGLNFVEWIDQVPGAARSDRLEVDISFGSNDVRNLRLRAFGAMRDCIQGST